MIKKCLTYFLILICMPVAGQELLFSFMNEAGVHLRWKGKYDKNFSGYNVYRKSGSSDWELLTKSPLQYAQSTNEAQLLSGNKKEILYGMLDKAGGGINAQELVKLSAESKLFESVCVVNPELAWMLGERYTDATALKSTSYSYKITWLDGDTERDWLQKDVGSFQVETVPPPGEVRVVASDGLVTLSLKPSQADLKSGAAITWHIYRSASSTGTFEKISYENPLPVSVSSGGQKSEPTLSFLDAFLSNNEAVYYRVKMVNATGVESRFSKIYKAIPKEVEEEIGFAEFDVEVLANTAVLSWEVNSVGAQFQIFATSGSDVDFMRVHEGFTSDGERNWIDSDYKAGMTRAYFIRVTDEGKTYNSDTLRISSLDYLPPKPVTNPRTELLDSAIVKISWSPSISNDVVGYEIERSRNKSKRAGLKINKGYIADTAFVDTLDADFYGKYYYRIYAVDHAYNASIASEYAIAMLADRNPPQTPRVWSLKLSGDTAHFEWSPSADLDIAYFEVFSAGELVNGNPSETTNRTQMAIAVPDTGRFGFFVQAVDSSNNRSSSSDTLYITRKPTFEPPAFVSAEALGTGLTLKWEASDTLLIRRVLLTRIDPATKKRLDIWEGPPTSTDYFDAYADPEKSWRFEIRVYNREWVSSEPSVFRYRPPEE